MRFDLPVRTLIFAASGLVGAASAASNGAGLSLTADVGGRFAPVTALRAGRVICREGDNDLTPATNGVFRLEGELSEAIGIVHWGIEYLLLKPTAADAQVRPARPSVCVVRVAASLGESPAPAPIWFFDRWPKVAPEPGLLIFAWVLNGRIDSVRVEKITPRRGYRLDVGHVFRLTADEARGRPIVLYWTGGKFIPPVPELKTVVEVKHRMLSGDSISLEQTLLRQRDARLTANEKSDLLLHAADAGILPAVKLFLDQPNRPNLLKGSVEGVATLAAMRGRSPVVALVADAPEMNSKMSFMLVVLSLIFGHPDEGVAFVPRIRELTKKEFDMLVSISVFAGHPASLRALLVQGAQLDGKASRSGWMLVDQARLGRLEMARILLEQKVDPNTVYDGETALILAAKRGDEGMVGELLRAGANVNLAGAAGVTPLLAACGSGNPAVARMLLAAGGDVRRSDASGHTSLHFAIAWDDLSLATALVDAGADVNATTHRGSRPLDHALNAGFSRCARQLAKWGARLRAEDELKPTLLEAALVLDVPELIETALARGWSPAVDFRGWPALAIAELCNSVECAGILRPKLNTAQHSAPIVVSANTAGSLPTLKNGFRPPDPRNPDRRTRDDKVVMEFVVDAAGSVVFPRITKYDDPRLAQSALRNIVDWKFSPAILHGNPVAVRVSTTMEFHHDDELPMDALRTDVPPTICSIAGAFKERVFTREEEQRLAGAGIEVVVGLLGQVEEVNFRGPISQPLVEKARKEIGRLMFTPSLSGNRNVRTRMKLPAAMWDE